MFRRRVSRLGQIGGLTIEDWYPKVKCGGLIAGDDYDSRWPLVVKSVDHFADALGVELDIFEASKDSPYAQYPSWCVTKPERVIKYRADANLVKMGRRVQKWQELKYFIKKIIYSDHK